jgi:hypothetical protein
LVEKFVKATGIEKAQGEVFQLINRELNKVLLNRER